MSRKLSFTEKRRARLAMKWDQIEKLETKSTITEPISVLGLSVSAFRGLAQLGIMQADCGNSGLLTLARLSQQANQAPVRAQKAPAMPVSDLAIGLAETSGSGAGGGGTAPADMNPSAPSRPISTIESPGLVLGAAPDAAQSQGISAPWHPASPAAGGAALPPRGGSGGPSPALVAAASPIQVNATATPARNSASNSAAGSSSAAAASALLSTLGLGAGSAGASASSNAAPAGAAAAPIITRNTLAAKLTSGGGTSGHSLGFSPLTSPAFELETLDYNDGSVLVPGYQQLATPGGSVDLRAQVRDSATGTYTYSWSTTGLTSANTISGSSTYDLTFDWNTTIATSAAESVTLTVTDPNLAQVSQTYTFWVPAGTGMATGGTTWNNTTLDPGLLQASAPAWSSQNVSVVEDTGAAETSITLPSYNPNIQGLSLNYDSLAANALPIIVAEHALNPSLATPSQVSAQLTFDGTAGSTYYFSTSSLRPGDIMQIGLQANAATLDTGSYPYTMTISDIRGGAHTTFTYTGNATVENAAEDPTFSALGAGWTIGGLDKIVPATGGVILDEGSGTVAWFSGSFGGSGGTYTSPAGTFSTLVLNSNGTYTLTETDGTVENFNSSGLETTSVDRNGLTTTFAYSSNRLVTVTDPFSKTTSFTYSSGQLQSIEDPASRLTTFTLSSGDLTAVEYPDTSTWHYGYDGSNRLTSVTEPSSTGEPTKITTITYDSAERVGTITRADSTTEEFSPAQVQGWTNSGTTGSPAASVLLSEVGSTYTDPLGDVTTDSPDWRGMGVTNQETDALDYVTTMDRGSNGLATVSIDPLNRITQAAYDSKGNVTKITYPDGTTTTYGTYNSFAEPATTTDQLGRITTYTYDAQGNLTVEEDALDNVTTYTYSATQPGMLTAQTAPAPAGSSSYTLVSYQYDSQDRQTTITDADNDVTVNVYNSAGDITQTTDPDGTVTTYAFDGMNRETGMTNAAGTVLAGVTTMTYDAGGNETTVTDAADETTTTVYDALDRVSTVKDADLGVTSYAYDKDGRLQVLTDPDANATTYVYNADGEQIEVTSPSVNNASGVSATFVYDGDGELTDTTDADGRRTTYGYDQLGREVAETWISGGTVIAHVTFTYDADGEMTGADNPYAAVTFSYDNGGNLQTEATSGPGTGQPSVTLTYSYDPSHDLTSVKDSLSGSGALGQGITTYVYDNALRLTTVTQSAGGTAGPEVTMTYDAAGNITKEFLSNAGTGHDWITLYSYDAAENLTTMVAGSGTEGSGILPHGDFEEATYNSDDQLTYLSTGSTTNSYTYDADSQLTGSSGTNSLSYGYDANGNRNTTGYTTGAGNETTNSPGVTYTYDNTGNVITATTSSGTTTYTYDYKNRLTNVDINGTMSATYTYDALGRRIGIDDSGTQTWTVFNGKTADDNPYADFNSSGNMQTRYLDGLAVDELFARTSSSGVTAWYLRDRIGSVTEIVSTSSSSVLDEIIYDPFGNLVTETNATNGDRFKFAGMEYDTVAGLYYDHARYYDATIGRFVSQDPKGFSAGDTNLYAYAGNSPNDSVDPTGTQHHPSGGHSPGSPAGSGPKRKSPTGGSYTPPDGGDGGDGGDGDGGDGDSDGGGDSGGGGSGGGGSSGGGGGGSSGGGGGWRARWKRGRLPGAPFRLIKKIFGRI